MNYHIASIGYYVPEHVLDNDYIKKATGADGSFLEKKIGITARRVAAPEELTSDMAYKSASRLIKENEIDKNSIDLVLICTQNPDYRLPTTACILQSKLGLKKSCLAFDVNLGCSGFVYSVVIAGSLLINGMIQNALVTMSEQYSKIIDYKDRNTASIFGDAAASALITSCSDDYGVIDASFGTDGTGAKSLILPNSGVAKDSNQDGYLIMDGRAIFNFAVRVIPESVQHILDRNGLKIEDIKFFVFHQANQYILKEIGRRLSIRSSQLVIDMKEYGNTVSASIPIALKNVMDKKLLTAGDLVILCGFGVGLSWGTILYKFGQEEIEND